MNTKLNQRFATTLTTLVYSILSLTLSGCGSDQPELGQVTGTVFYEGLPLSNASVTFTPEAGRPASAVTDNFGTYELVYIRDTPGCKVGKNKVTIESSVEGQEGEEFEGDEFDQTKTNTEKIKLPAKYNSETELFKDVASGKNEFDFHLEKNS